jgi:hypothetical protein
MYELLNSKITKDLVTQTQDHTTPRDSKLKILNSRSCVLVESHELPRQAAGLRLCLFLVLLAVLLESLPSLATKELVVLGINGITARLECLLIAADQLDQDHDEGGKVVLVDVQVSEPPGA